MNERQSKSIGHCPYLCNLLEQLQACREAAPHNPLSKSTKLLTKQEAKQQWALKLAI